MTSIPPRPQTSARTAVPTPAPGGFTGRHMLAIMLGFFGIIIAVNVTMATLAGRTFGGTVVDNSYVASQKFNGWLKAARAERTLGWTGTARLDAQRHVRVTGPLTHGTAIARHPLGRAPNIDLAFIATPGGLVSTTALPPGRWIVRLTLHRASETRHIESDLS